MKMICCMVLLFSLECTGQSAYREFLKRDDATQQNSFFQFMFAGQLSFSDYDLKNYGLNTFFGFNAGRFFSKKIILGIGVNARGFKGFFKQQLSSEFVNDFNANFISSYSSVGDSVRANLIYKAVNGGNFYFQGNYFSNIGVTFSPFPQKYGGFLLYVNRGIVSFPIYDAYNYPYIENGDSDFAFLDFSKVYKFNLFFKPTTLTKKSSENTFYGVKWHHRIVVGLYYERFSLYHNDFYGTTFKDIVKSEFMDKYGIQHRFGFSVAVGFY